MADISTPESGGLRRSRNDRMILGLCGGIAAYYNMDSTLIRVLMFLLTLSVIGLLGYIVLGLIVPEE